MTHAEHPAEGGVVDLFADGVAGILLGLGTFPLVALLSPFCLVAGSAGACGALSRGPFILLEVGAALPTHRHRCLERSGHDANCCSHSSACSLSSLVVGFDRPRVSTNQKTPPRTTP